MMAGLAKRFRESTIVSVFFWIVMIGSVSAQVDFPTDSSLLANYGKKNLKPGTATHMQNLHYRHKTVLKLFLGLYKTVLSDQISANCEFVPSCSSFSWLALDEFGFLKALLLTADRLARCNGNAQSEIFSYLVRHDDAKIMDYPYQYKFTEQ
jgi:putative component of membrane protein insertase Oxa1/YidC/SpoIIIJ protein YidD